MKNENTTFDNETTRLDATTANPSSETAQNADASGAKKGIAWGKVAAGSGAGILLGSIAAFTATKANASNEITTETDEQPVEEHPDWTDGQVAVATSVNDDMSFSEAFAAARAEVGPGGAFEWHGNVYGTYLADEWNSMSAEEQQAYGAHFNWNNHSNNYSGSHTGSSHNTQGDDTADLSHGTDSHGDQDHSEPTDTDTSVEEIRLDTQTITTDIDTNTDTTLTEVEVQVAEDNTDVQILGVSHDSETGINYGGMIVDGQDIFLIDVDGDGTFDVMVSDVNNNNQFDENEYHDISEQQITVQEFEQMAGGDTMYANNNGETDYINETDDNYDMA